MVVDMWTVFLVFHKLMCPQEPIMGSWCPSKHSWQNLYKNALRSPDLKARFKPRLHIWSLSCLGRGALDRNTSAFNLMTSFTCAMITPLSLRVSYSIGKFSQVTISGLLCTTYNNQNSFTFTQKLCITFHAKKWWCVFRVKHQFSNPCGVE